MVDGVDRELGFDLEALGKHGEGFDEWTAHGAVTGHDVIETVAIDPLDHGSYQVVAKAVEGALVLLGVGAVGKAIAHGHVGRAVKDGLAKGLCRFGGVGVVAIDHQVAVGIDVAKHLAAHVALSLTRLKADRRAMLCCDAGSLVRRVIVIDINRRLRKLAVKVVDDLTDRKCFVVAGDNDGNGFRIHSMLLWN